MHIFKARCHEIHIKTTVTVLCRSKAIGIQTWWSKLCLHWGFPLQHLVPNTACHYSYSMWLYCLSVPELVWALASPVLDGCCSSSFISCMVKWLLVGVACDVLLGDRLMDDCLLEKMVARILLRNRDTAYIHVGPKLPCVSYTCTCMYEKNQTKLSSSWDRTWDLRILARCSYHWALDIRAKNITYYCIDNYLYLYNHIMGTHGE